MHDRYYVETSDKGICAFCGQSIEIYEDHTFVKLEDGDESRIAHEHCFEERKSNYQRQKQTDVRP